MNKLIPLILATSVTGLVGCGGGGGGDSSSGGGGGSVSGLEMPVALSVVTASEGSGAGRVAALKTNFKAVIAALNDSTTDFTMDEQHAWVHDRALEPLESVNNILCYIGQTGADQLVNKTYVALIDGAKCEREGGDSSSGGQNQSSGGGKTVEYEKWVVTSTRADDTSPQIVKIWAPEGGDNEMPMEIRAEVTVTEGVSDTNPFGKFVLNFAGVAKATFTLPWDPSITITEGQVMMSGTLKTVDVAGGKIGFTLFENDPSGGQRKVSVVTSADQTSGVAFTGGIENDGMGNTSEKAYAVAFDASHILVKRDLSFTDLAAIDHEAEGSGAVCLDRENFKRNVWRYNLYHGDTGARVALNSGFPFRWDSNSDGTNDSYGHASYWGIWSEEEPAGGWNGATITKETYGQNATSEDYTVLETPGKLTKREKETLLLTALEGETFHYNDWNTGTEYIVEYDGNASLGATAGFYKIQTVVYNMGSPPTTTDITPTLMSLTTGDWLGMWSEGLGGGVNFIGGDDHVTFFKESFVDASDSAFGTGSSIALKCFNNCLMPNLTNLQYGDPWTNGAYYPESTDVAIPAATYAFDKTTLSLTVTAVAGNASHADVGEVVKLGQTYTYDPMSGGYEPWGISIDGLVPVDATLTNVWDTWGQAVGFRWETGHKSWNKLVRVIDQNGTPTDTSDDTMVAFDKPMAFKYQHTTANDANADATFNGKTFMMNYGGNGDLWGIPWVDADTGAECTGGGNMECRPAFAIIDGGAVGESNEYVVKAIDMELKPLATAGQCTTLFLEQPAQALPTAASGTPSHVATAAPTPDSDAPAVIAGEVQ